MNSSRRIFPTEYVTLRNSVRRKNSNYPRIRTTVLWATSCCSVSSDTRKNLQFHLARLHVLFVNHLVQRNLKNPGHVFWTRKFSLGARTTLSFFRPSPIVHEACSSFYRDFPSTEIRRWKAAPIVADNCLANWPTWPRLISPLNASWPTVYV